MNNKQAAIRILKKSEAGIGMERQKGDTSMGKERMNLLLNITKLLQEEELISKEEQIRTEKQIRNQTQK